MLIVALVLAVIGLVALVAAVVTTNEVIAWVCIAASALGVVLLVVDAVRERQQRRLLPVPMDSESSALDDETTVISEEETAVIDRGIDEEIAVEDHPEEIVHDEPEYDTPIDDEPEYPQAAEEAALHVVDEADEADESPSGR